MNIEKNKESADKRSGASNFVRWGLLFVVTIMFSITLYPNLIITKHSYKLGDVAERDIKAPKDFFIEDKDVTETNRRRAVEGVLTVYDHDTTISSKLSQNAKKAFADIQAVFEAEKERQKKHDPHDPMDITAEPPHVPITPSLQPTREKLSLHEQILQMKENFEATIGITVSNGAYAILEKEKFSRKIANLINTILSTILENGVVANKEILLLESGKGITLRAIGTKTESAVLNLKHFYSLDQAKIMVRIIGDPLLKNFNYTSVNLVVDFVQRLIHPNITLNKSATEERKKKAASEIKPILYKIKEGEMLLREGERVTKVQLLKLKALEAQTKDEQIFTSTMGSALIILCILIITYTLHIKHNSTTELDNNKNLIFIASIIITFFLLAEVSASISEVITQNTTFSISTSSITYGIPIASGAMIICLFVGFEVALPFALVIAAFTAVIFQNKFEIFIYFLLNGSMAAYWIANCRERKMFIWTGVKLGFLNILLATTMSVYAGHFSGINILWDWAFAFMGGIGAGIITLGIAPLVEITFAYTTDITLLELANLDKPILRRLMIEAPGTYHHSVIVGSLVEAAASEIGANPLLAKVCGYYHDIGKIKQPLYFIENQTNGKNKHDKLEPSMSSLILIAHIKNGVEIARKNKLGQVIINSIREHHGTSLISYFYEKAKQRKGENAVTIDNFRYPGPRPQTREAGLVMLADVVEAASRTLDNPTPSRIQGLVQNLMNKIFSDGQLDNCELTLKDLHGIAKSFNTILNGIHHHRIEYLENLTPANGKDKNGSPDRQQAKQTRNLAKENSAKDRKHLKRLGQS